MRFACAIVVAAWFMHGCSSQACTRVACVNGLDVGLRTETGTWADGRYTVSFTAPQQKYECAFQLPLELPIAPQWSKPLDCAPGGAAGGRFTGTLQRYTACEQPRGADPKSTECERAADHVMLRTRFDEVIPETLHLRVEHEGTATFEELRTVRYEEWYPNGPECDRDPCRSSNIELTMASDD